MGELKENFESVWKMPTSREEYDQLQAEIIRWGKIFVKTTTQVGSPKDAGQKLEEEIKRAQDLLEELANLWFIVDDQYF